jgi:16S rRNA (guanine527-N7)-methyltransferase
MTDKRASALSLIDATSSNARDLDIFIERLARWRKITNLVSDATFADVWSRHIADCGQLLELAPLAKRWVDMGSGAGFPGMVIGILLKGIEGAEIHCIESDRRKCAFLREVARATGAPVAVHPTRVEEVDARSLLPVDAVTARALAPLSQLVELAQVWLANGAIGIFPRGRSANEQIEAFPNQEQFQIETLPSKVEPEARIVRLRRAPQVP